MKKILKYDLYKTRLKKDLSNDDMFKCSIDYFEDKIESIISLLLIRSTPDDLDLKLKKRYLKDLSIKDQDEKLASLILEISVFDCFEDAFNKRLQEKQSSFDETLTDSIKLKIDGEKELIFKDFNLLNKIKIKKDKYLNMKRNKILTKTLEIGMIIFLSLCASIIYQIGISGYTIAITILISITFTFVMSFGEYFEILRFRGKVRDHIPKLLEKSIGFLSYFYMFVFGIVTLVMIACTLQMMFNKIDLVLGLNNEIMRNVIISITLFTAVVWHLRMSRYQKRYSMFQKFESKHNKEDVAIFLNKVVNEKDC